MNQFSNFLQDTTNCNEIVDKCQKDFIKSIEGCAEHAATINSLIRYAIANKKNLFIATLDCRDAFGSVPHKLLNKSLINFGVTMKLVNVIMDSYKVAAVNIFTIRVCSRDVAIKRGVKQGYPLSPLLFDIAIDPIFNFLRHYAPYCGYETEVLGRTNAQAYANDLVLVDSSPANLQKQIEGCQQFFGFANIKLNPAKCEVLKVIHDLKYYEKIKIGEKNKNPHKMRILLNSLGPLSKQKKLSFIIQ
jgi:hypothetical protein